MKLPLQTNIPLDVLNTRIDETFPKKSLSVRTWNCLQNASIERNWQLLVQTEASLLKMKNLGRAVVNEIIIVLGEKGWKLNTFFPEALPLSHRIYLDEWSWVLPVVVIGPDRVPPIPERQHVTHFFKQHGLHANMTIDELFVYVSTERPLLSEAQVAFLRKWPPDTFTSADELA